MIKHIPNILTMGRFVLAGIFLAMILYAPGYYEDGSVGFPGLLDWAFLIFVIAGITDAIDGHIARSLDVVSQFGRIVDPLADKVLVCGAFLCFAIIGQPVLFGLSGATLAVIQWATAAVLIVREVYVTVLRHYAEAKGINFAATKSGKIKMLLQSIAIGSVVIKIAHFPTNLWASWFVTAIYLLMVGSTVLSGIRATRRKSWQQLNDNASESVTDAESE